MNKLWKLIQSKGFLFYIKFSRIYEAIVSGQKSLRKNTAFKASHFDLTIVEDKKIQRIREKIADTNKRINEYKMIMERILIQREWYEDEIQNLEVEK